MHLRGSNHLIDSRGIRDLTTIRPLWLPALRSNLDPQNKGYVKPEDYFTLIHNRSLFDTLRRLVFESAGYGTVVECERDPSDLSLPARWEVGQHHIGWTSAEIVAIPTPAELGIVTVGDTARSSGDAVSQYFDRTGGDVYVWVRYLQTGQIERKSLTHQIRPAGGLSLGAELCHHRVLDSDGSRWSEDCRIVEFKACEDGDYIITVRGSHDAVELSTNPLGPSCCSSVDVNDSSPWSALPKTDYMLLGPTKTFIHPPKVDEKIQVRTRVLKHSVRFFLR